MIRLAGSRFADEHGRTLVLRGVNLGGSSKVPRTPDGATWRREGFLDHRAVSFVGRPFPLAEADEHYARLARWGLRTLRFLTTWEALEHEGPRRYDAAYLDYLEAVVRKAGEHGLTVFIDFHQDVWSRFCGGDGAPGWTLEAAGFQLEHLHPTGAAFVHGQHEGPLPKMIWPSNAGKLAAATMFTLFFGGDAFAPKRRIDGEGAQRFLQEHFLGAVEQVVRRLANVPCVAGYDVLNEPSAGYVGVADLTRPFGPVQVGALPSPLDSMALGDGSSRSIACWTRGVLGARVVGRATLNPNRLRAWRQGASCPWRDEGVWTLDAAGEPKLLEPDHFARRDGRAVSWSEDFYKPFMREAVKRLHAIAPQAIVFVEGEAQREGPAWDAADGAVAWGPHWYDGVVLFLKDYRSFLGVDFFTEKPVFFASRVRRSYAAQLQRFTAHAAERMGGVPVLLGEVGIAFDLRGKAAYRTGDFRLQERAMDRSLTAVEDAMLSATLWNYTADNTNERGDQWNDEDLSIYSADQRREPANPDSGGRALEAVVRPYPLAVAGTPRSFGFELKTRRFELTFRHDPNVNEPTQVFVPALHYPNGVDVTVSDGRFEHHPGAQRLDWWHDRGVPKHHLTVSPR